MRAIDALIRGRGSRPHEVARVTAALREDPAAGLAALARLSLVLDERLDTPQARLAALEALRPAWLAVIEPTVRPLRNRPLPLDEAERVAFHRLAVALRAVRDAWRRAHAVSCDADPSAAAGSPSAPAAGHALARALDAQSRLLTSACRLRIALPRDDWDALCGLGHALSTAGALDVPGPGEDSPAPRVVLAAPLLMRLLEPLGLGGAALELAAGIARAAAPETGLTIDVDGRPQVSAQGPAMVLSLHHTVRLDTRRARAAIGRARRRLAEGVPPAAVGLRTWMSPGAVDRLLAQLETVWAPGHVPTPLAKPTAPRALMRIGMPRRTDLPDTPAPGRGSAFPGRDGATGASASGLYRYGRATGGGSGAGGVEFTRPESAGVGEATPVRAAADAERRAAAAQALMAADGDPVDCRGQDTRRAVFRRTADTPRLRLGDLVAVQGGLPARGVGRPGPGPLGLRLGRIETLVQAGAADGREPTAHDVGVSFWPGVAVPVRVCASRGGPDEAAWWLPGGVDGEPPSLVLRRDRVDTPAELTIVEPAGVRRVRALRLLERGAEHDRLALGA